MSVRHIYLTVLLGPIVQLDKEHGIDTSSTTDYPVVLDCSPLLPRSFHGPVSERYLP